MTLFDAFPDAFPEFVTNAPEGPNAGAAPDPDADGVADSNPDADSDPSTASVPDQEAEAVPEPDSEGAVGPIPDPSSDPGTDPPFDLCDDLPRGKLAIQASAGTGKTYALAALATRFIAETDLSASELLIVTFTRAATNELRAKVRDRLVEAVEYLDDPQPAPTDDVLLSRLASEDRQLRLDRLRRAVTEFDTATVTTIHGFANQVRTALGGSSVDDPDLRLTDDSDELIHDACAEVLTCAALEGHPVEQFPTLYSLRQAVKTVDGRPDLVLVPQRGQSGASEAQQYLVELVERATTALSTRRRQSGLLSFDDVLIQLRDALERQAGAGAVEALRARYRVALIDEFQDTDPVQWDIFSTLFDRPGVDTALVLVGDPKQAIYGFRGADVHTYLKAVGDDRTERRSLATNWRSDGAVLDSVAALLTGATFGDADIPFVPVSPPPLHRHRRLVGADGSALPALSLRLAVGDGIERQRNERQSHMVVTWSADRAVCMDLVAQVRDLLDGAQIPDHDGPGGSRPVRPTDVAVLVATHRAAAEVQAALLDQGVPAVVAKGTSVLESPAAEQMRWLLESMARPSDPRRVRMFALSWFVGWTVSEVDSATDADLVMLQEQVRQWAELLGTTTVADVLARVWSESGLAARVLGGPGGDRNMTDLDHLAELFSGTAPGGRSGVAGLLAVLDAEPEDDVDSEFDGSVAARRIETEAEAVQIMTVWTAKGLEFPIVCLPTLWHPSTAGLVAYLDPVTERRTLDLSNGGDWPDANESAARKERAAAEATGERLRLLYVALTRAAHQTVVWWARTIRSDTTALARVLFARADGVIDADLFGADRVPIPPDADILASLQTLVDASGGTIATAVIDEATEPVDRWVDRAEAVTQPALTVAEFDVAPDRSRHRWSFSAIVNDASGFDPYDPTVSDRGATDEQDEDGPLDGGVDPLLDASPMRPGVAVDGPVVPAFSALPAGPAFGTLVHTVLEGVDFTAPDLDRQLGAAIDRELAWRSLDLTPVATSGRVGEDGRRLLIEGLEAALHTPLGPRCDGASLADIRPSDRLNEVSFDLLLAPSGRPAPARDIGRLLLSYMSPGDPLGPWAERLAEGAVDLTLAGHLTGSIDLVMRIGSEPESRRFVVADYKTNDLSLWGTRPQADDYRPERMAEAMIEHDYPLQALLYSVALHRYLRWRLRGYTPESHLGGAVYLFLRGMVGAGAATAEGEPHGVFSWGIPPDLVVELSDLLAGRMTSVGSR